MREGPLHTPCGSTVPRAALARLANYSVRRLLAGLGGGALVRFLNHYFPQLRLDVVEIDPVVVRVAREFFGTIAGPRKRVFIADGRDHLRQTAERYDLILLDAHLPPGERTDSTGHPLNLKAEAFYRSLHQRLRPGGWCCST